MCKGMWVHSSALPPLCGPARLICSSAPLVSMSVRQVFALCAVVCALLAPAVAQPNVVLIVADDMGFGDVGYNGSEIATPHLDQLAAEGVVLDRFYTSPLCSPSRAGLLTGRYPIRMGINEPVTRADTVGLPQAETTLAEALKASGYETSMVGKWHLGDDCPYHPGLHGFDAFLGMLGGGANYYNRLTIVGPDWWRGVVPVDTGGYTTDLIADEAVEVLSVPRLKPLFLYLPFTAPHTPLQAPEEDIALYASLPEPRRTYAAMVTNLDRSIGRIMETIRASSSERETVVWFLSDNGGAAELGGDNGPLRGKKGQSWEGGIRVPSVVWAPQRFEPRVIEHPVWYLDVFPTVMGLVPGASPPLLPLDGANQGPQLAGERPTDTLLERLLYSYRRTGSDGSWLGVQNATWKYTSRRTSENVAQGFFRIDLDPSEQSDSLSTYRPMAQAFQEAGLAFADLTLPGASSDITLETEQPADLSDCPGILSVPSPPGASDLGLRVGPNPFSTSATIEVTSKETRFVIVELMDVVGRRVRTLYEGAVTANVPRGVALRRGGLPSGTYFVRVTGGGGSALAQVTLAR